MKGQFKLIPPNDIIVGDRYRKGYPNIAPLAKSIEEEGLAVPLQVDEGMNLVYGGRRLQACKIAGLKKVPVIIRKDLDPVASKKLELLENLFRESYTPYEECKAKRDIDQIQKKLHGDQSETRDRTSWSLRKTADLLGESAGGVSQDIALADAMDAFPELQECATKNEAHKILKKILEKGAEKVLMEKSGVRSSEAFKHANRHYKVGDCVVGLKDTPEGGAILAEVDPPFAVKITKVKGQKSTERSELKTYNEVSIEEYVILISDVAKELYRILPEDAWIVWWFGNVHYDVTYHILTEAGFQIDKVPAIWFKDSGGQTLDPEFMLARDYESFFIGRKGRPVLRRRGRSNVFPYKPLSSDKKIHITEKPIELMEEIIDLFMFPHSVAIVPFLGSGVTLRALYKTNRMGFGWDLSQEHKDSFLINVAKDIEEGIYEVQDNKPEEVEGAI